MKHKKESPLIHIRFEDNEAREMKKNLLHLKLSTIKILQAINNYKELRKKHNEYKENLYGNIRQTHLDLNKLRRAGFPKIDKTALVKKIEQNFSSDQEDFQENKKLSKENYEKALFKNIPLPPKNKELKKEETKDNQLQEELMSIQEQLRMLE